VWIISREPSWLAGPIHNNNFSEFVSLRLKKNLSHGSDIGFKGIILNRACHSLNVVLLKIRPSVIPLIYLSWSWYSPGTDELWDIELKQKVRKKLEKGK